jgi:hypothetical protein
VPISSNSSCFCSNVDHRSSNLAVGNWTEILNDIYLYLKDLSPDEHDNGSNLSDVINQLYPSSSESSNSVDYPSLAKFIREDRLHRFFLIKSTIYGFFWIRKGTKESSFCRWFVYYYLRNHTNEANKTIIFNNLPSMLQPYFPLITSKLTLEGIIKDGLYGDRRFQISQTPSSNCLVVTSRNHEKKKSIENVRISGYHVNVNDGIKDDYDNSVGATNSANDNDESKDCSAAAAHDLSKSDDGVNSDLSSNSDVNNSNPHSEAEAEEKSTSVEIDTVEETQPTSHIEATSDCDVELRR